jgi:cell division protein FtsB
LQIANCTCLPCLPQAGIEKYEIRNLKSEMKKKRILLFTFSLFLILGFLTFFGDKGIFHLIRLQKELVRIKGMNTKMEGENRNLKEEVRRLQHEKRYIEEIARKELGMVKEGEIIYQFDLPNDKKENSKDK